MATDIASLILAVDSTQVSTAQRELDKLTGAGKRAEGGASNLKGGYIALAGAAVGVAVGIVAVVAKTIAAADAMYDLHLKTGLAFKDLATFKLLADQSGSSTEGMANAVKFLSKYMVENADLLKKIGVTSKDVNGVMRELADVIADTRDPALRTALAMEVMSRAGAEMIPVLIGGSAAFDKAQERTKKYAEALEKAAPQSDQFKDTMAELKLETALVALNLTNELLPGLNALATVFNNASKESDGFKSTLSGLAAHIVTIANELDNLSIVIQLVSILPRAAITQAALLAQGEVKKAMAVGWEALELADKLAMSYNRVAREAEKANAQAPGFVGPPSPGKDSAVRGILDKAALQAMKEAAKAAEDFVAALKKEYDMLGLTTEQAKLYEIQNAKLPPSLLNQALALHEVGEAKRKQVELDKKAADLTKQNISSMEQELLAMQQQTKEMGLSREALIALTIVRAQAAAIEAQARLGDEMMKEGGGNSARIAQLQQELELRNQIVVAATNLGTATAKFQSLQDGAAGLSDSAGALADSFGRVGSAIGGMTTALAAFGEQQKKNAEIVKLGGTDRSMQNQIRFYGDMASAAKGFFKEGTKGYKAMETAEKIYRAYQFAMFAKEAVMQALALLAPMKAAAANVASVPIVVAAEEAKSVAAGTTAAAIAAQSSPWTGLITMAAMIAALIAIGVKMSGSGGAKGNISQQRQESAGTGSVFGDASAKSESIANSIKILEENSFTDLEYTNQMLEELRAIRSNIEGLVNITIRRLSLPGGPGDTSGVGLGTTTTSPIPTPFGDNQAMNQLFTSGIWGLFATKVSKKLIDYGILIVSQTISEIIEKGLQAFKYQTIETTTKKFLGLSKKVTISEIVGPLDDEFTRQFTMIILGIRDAVITAGEVLGIFGDDLSDFVVDIGHISLEGMTGEEIQAQFEAIFSKLGDDMAKTIFPAVTEFAKVGEGAMETLTRLARDYQIVDLVLKSIGQTFTLVGVASIEARERLIELSGGIEDFIAQAQAFADTYLTDAERAAPILNAVLAELNRLGISGVYTMDAFRDLVLSLDLTTEEGAALYAALMKLAPAFATAVNAVHDAIQRYFDLVLEAQQFQFQMQQNIANLGTGGGGTGALIAMGNTLIEQYRNVTTTLEDKLAILNQLSGLVGQWVQQRMREIANEREAVTEASNEHLKILNEQLKLAQKWAGVLSQAKQMLDSMKFTTTNPLPTSGRLNLASIEVARLQQQLAGAAPEDRAELSKKLLDALQKQLTLAQEFYQRPSPEYQAIYNDIIRQVTAIETEAQTNADEALRIQIEISALQEATVEQLKAIDAQIAAVNAQAIDWYSQIAAEGALVYEELRKQAEADLLDLADAAGQRDAIIDILTEINAKLGVPPPGFAEGLANVPYDNFNARLHKGERVLTAQENRSYASGGNTITLNIPLTINGGSKSDADAIAAAVDKRVKQTLPYIKQQLKRA